MQRCARAPLQFKSSSICQDFSLVVCSSGSRSRLFHFGSDGGTALHNKKDPERARLSLGAQALAPALFESSAPDVCHMHRQELGGHGSLGLSTPNSKPRVKEP